MTWRSLYRKILLPNSKSSISEQFNGRRMRVCNYTPSPLILLTSINPSSLPPSPVKSSGLRFYSPTYLPTFRHLFLSPSLRMSFLRCGCCLPSLISSPFIVLFPSTHAKTCGVTYVVAYMRIYHISFQINHLFFFCYHSLSIHGSIKKLFTSLLFCFLLSPLFS